MKNKRISIIVLMIGLVLIIIGLLLNSLSDKINNKDNNNLTDKTENDSNTNDPILIDASYTCEKEPFNYTGVINNKNTTFTSISYYDFSTYNNEIILAKIYTVYKFDNITSFDNFEWNEKNSNMPMSDIKFDSDKLTKTYYWTIMIPNKDSNNSINKYLEQLSKDGYKCILN